MPTTRNLTTEQCTALEALVDATSLEAVLNALAMIASEKAEHLRSNWQDAPSAKAWDRDAAVIGKAAAKVEG